MNKTTYDAVENHFRKLWGQEAGWAHSVLFTADLRSFADRLAATKKVDVSVKKEIVMVKSENEEVEIKDIKTEETATVTLAAPKEEVDIKIEVEEKPATKGTRGKKRKGSTEGVVHASQSTETRRMSKRLRK